MVLSFYMEVNMSLKSAIMDELNKGKGSQNTAGKKENKNRYKPISNNTKAHQQSLSSLLIKSRLDRLFYLRDEKDELLYIS